MAYGRHWKPSKSAAKEFAQTMDEIATFCKENGIQQSRRGDSYYFMIGDVRYRVSNHTIEASNRAAFDEFTGEQVRELYHDSDSDTELVCITAGKTRIREIYADLKAGYKLDGRGNRVD